MIANIKVSQTALASGCFCRGQGDAAGLVGHTGHAKSGRQIRRFRYRTSRRFDYGVVRQARAQSCTPGKEAIVAQSISTRIYEAFFTRLSEAAVVRPETIAALRSLYSAGHLDSKAKLKLFAQDMEQRHAQDQDTDD